MHKTYRHRDLIAQVAAEVQAEHPDWRALDCFDLAFKIVDQMMAPAGTR